MPAAALSLSFLMFTDEYLAAFRVVHDHTTHTGDGINVPRERNSGFQYLRTNMVKIGNVQSNHDSRRGDIFARIDFQNQTLAGAGQVQWASPVLFGKELETEQTIDFGGAFDVLGEKCYKGDHEHWSNSAMLA